MGKIFAPWTDERVDLLNSFQALPYIHTFTCGKCRADLVATKEGWKCNNDDYTQDWAHDFMADKERQDAVRMILNPLKSEGEVG